MSRRSALTDAGIGIGRLPGSRLASRLSLAMRRASCSSNVSPSSASPPRVPSGMASGRWWRSERTSIGPLGVPAASFRAIRAGGVGHFKPKPPGVVPMQSHSARGDHQRRAQGDGRGETLNHFEQIAPVTARPYVLGANLVAVGGALLLEQNNEGSERLSPHRHAVGSATCRG